MPSRLIALVLSGAVVFVTPALAATQKQGRLKAKSPRTPYSYALHPGTRPTLPRLRIHPNARSPRTPYPGALHPEAPILLPQGFTMTVERGLGLKDSSAEERSIGRPRDIAERLADCWSPPAHGQGETLEISLRLGFSRTGGVIGPPAVTYVKASDDDGRIALRRSILAAVSACTPLQFTPDLGSAIAGRPFAIRFVAIPARPIQTLVP